MVFAVHGTVQLLPTALNTASAACKPTNFIIFPAKFKKEMSKHVDILENSALHSNFISHKTIILSTIIFHFELKKKRDKNVKGKCHVANLIT